MEFLFALDQFSNFYEAQSFCNINGGKVFEPRNENFTKNLLDYAKNCAVIDEFWLGINDNSEEGNFVYSSDNSTIKFENWNEGEPNNAEDAENCVEVKTDGFWNDISCHGYKDLIVCEKGN